MRDKELKSRGGLAAGGSHAVEIKAAMNEFLNEFSGFKSEINSKFKEQEDRLNMFNAKSLTASRPALSTAIEVGIPHKKAFSAYLRSGDDDALRGLPVEEKSLSTAVSADGGFLVDPQTADQITSVLRSASSIRSIANVVQLEATAYDVLVDHTLAVGSSSVTLNVIPSHAQVIGVKARVISPITGAGVSSWSLGVSGSIDRYGNGLGLALNAYVIGMSGPVTYWADTPLELTADAGSFDGGVVRLAVHFTELEAPRAV